MNTNIITAAAFLALAFSPSLASAGQAPGEDLAIDVCSDFNEYGPVELVGVNDDGMGDYMVWLEDADGYLWGCNVSEEGDIYVNVPMGFDLLEGEGAGIITVSAGRDPIGAVEKFCATLSENDVEVIASVEDGFGDYLVWLDNGDETFTMCNASAEGEVFAFETVSMPINEPVVIEEEEEPTLTINRPTRPTANGAGATQFG